MSDKLPLDYYIKRFFTLLKEENGCLIFQGPRIKKRYGTYHNHNEKLAHRFSWFIHNGPIPKGLHVLHKCDNPPCCNPEHLWLGTDKDNSDDKIRKNRDIKKHGENHPRSIMSDEIAKKIAILLSEGSTCADISLKLNISRYAIYHIKNKKVRKNLEFTIPVKIIKKKICIECNKEYRTKPYRFENSKYCSPKCRHKYHKGKTREQLKRDKQYE